MGTQHAAAIAHVMDMTLVTAIRFAIMRGGPAIAINFVMTTPAIAITGSTIFIAHVTSIRVIVLHRDIRVRAMELAMERAVHVISDHITTALRNTIMPMNAIPAIQHATANPRVHVIQHAMDMLPVHAIACVSDMRHVPVMRLVMEIRHVPVIQLAIFISMQQR